MRLNPFDTSKIDVRSSNGRSRPGPRAGGVGCGALIIALVGAYAFGLDPIQTLNLVNQIDQTGAPSQSQSASSVGGQSEEQICNRGPYAREACEALTSLNITWEAEFRRANIPFRQPFLDLFASGRVTTQGCGSATSASGPFYCPADYGIYIDTNFFSQLAQMSGTRGDFARLYVVAHEYGHHVQNLTGRSDQIRQLQRRNPRLTNQIQVRMELNADCLAGVWAGKNRSLIEPGDLQEGLRAASSIGDDTLMRQAGQRIKPEQFTHGTSEQRQEALMRGIRSGNASECDVYFDFR